MVLPKERQKLEQDRFVETGSGDVAVRTIGIGGSLITEEFDFVDCDYTDGELTLVTYKIGGASGATVATLTITYVDGCINTVTKA